MEVLELHDFKVATVQNICIHIQILKVKVISEGIQAKFLFPIILLLK